MNEIRERHERTASQTFITWYNRENRKAFEFVPQDCRGSGLTFRAGDHEVRAALTIAYYDYLDEQIRWLHGRDAPAALKIRIGFDLQAALVQTINDEIANQCAMESAPGRKLLIYVLPTVTTTTMMCEVLERVVLPERNTFEGVYLLGQFDRSKVLGSPELSIRQSV